MSAATGFERAIAVTGEPRIVEDATFWRGVALARGGEARVALGWLLFERGDRAGARRQFEAALQDTSARVREGARTGLAAIAKAG